MADVTLVRARARTLTIADIKDDDGAAAVLASADVFFWTARRYPGDDVTLLAKTSSDGGITFNNGADEAAVHLVPADFDDSPLQDIAFVFDVTLWPSGDEDAAVTIDTGTGLLVCDVTRAGVEA